MSVNVLREVSGNKKTFFILIAIFSLCAFIFTLVFFQERIFVLLLERGDRELTLLQFQRALYLYQQASLLKPWNKEVKERIDLALNIQNDPYLGMEFFKRTGASKIVFLLEKAKEEGNVEELIKNAELLLSSDMPGLATIPLEKASKIAPERRDILHLLVQLYHFTNPEKEKQLKEKLREDPIYQIIFAN